MSANARQFLDSLAATIEAAGRTLEWEERDLGDIVVVSFMTKRDNLWDANLSASAYFNERSRRWSFGGLTVFPLTAPYRTVKKRAEARIVAWDDETERIRREMERSGRPEGEVALQVAAVMVAYGRRAGAWGRFSPEPPPVTSA